MKLMHLFAYEPRGTRAIDHMALEFARQTHERGWSLTLGFTAAPPPSMATALTSYGARVHVFEYPFTARVARRLRRDPDVARPDVLVASFFSPFDWPLLQLKLSGFCRRLVVLDHASGLGPVPGGRGTLLRRARGAIVGRIVDAILPVSNFAARREVERVFLPRAKIVTVHNGIDLAHYPFAERRANGLPRVVYAGQLIPEKGILTLVHAVAALADVPFTLEIAGAGPQRGELEAFVRARGLAERVRFLGHVDSIPALFGSADVVVVPSEWAEAFGLVVAEAMACGAAVLASDAGGIPEVVGDAGRVFRAGDAVQLAAELRALLADEPMQHAFRQAGRARVERYFQIGPAVSQLLQVCGAVYAGQRLPVGPTL